MQIDFKLYPFSFIVGFVFGLFVFWLAGRVRPLLDQARQNMKEQREVAQVKRTSGLEDNHRRLTLRRAQGMHLAASLFSLDEILQEPRLLAPPVQVEPGAAGIQEDVISQTLPYMPMWPELASTYRAPTLGLVEAVTGGSNVVIVGKAGAGKTVALANLASLAANLKVQIDAGGNKVDAVPYFYHVADLQLPHDGTKDPLNVIINAASERAPVFDLNRLPQFIQQSFKSGSALVLVDGFDELEPQSQTQVVEWFKALSQAYPNIRIVTTGCADQLNGLVGIGFHALALTGWDSRRTAQFIEQWGQLWSQTVALEAWSQTGPEQVDPILLNSWLGFENAFLTPFELTLKVWGAYAGDSLGSRVLDAIATHIRRVAPSGTPVAALEMLAMQVVLTTQPIFDTSKARAWVKQYDLVEESPAEGEDTVRLITSEKIALTDSQKIKLKKSKAGDVPSTGLLGKLVESGLLVSHANSKMRFLHPVLNGYLAGQAIGDHEADVTLMAQPEWDGKTLALHYLAARGDATAVADYLLKESTLPLHNQTFTVARWLKDAPKQAAWRPKVFASLLSILQAEGQPVSLRAHAMAAFALSGDPGSATLFRQLLSSRSFDVIPLAALGSGAVRDTKAIEMLEEIMQAPVGAVRRAACLALVAIGIDKSLEAVARALLQGDEELRRAAAEAMANDPGEGYAMLKEGATLADIMLRRAVVHGLAHVEQPWAVEVLQHMQVEDDQWAVRNLANQYLEQMAHADPRVPHKLMPPSEAPWLIAFAGKNGKGIPRGSAATDTLLSAFKNGSTEERLAALPYLKRVANEGIIGALYHAMYGDDLEVREASFYALEEIGANGVKLPHPNQFGLG
ncbi:MAG: HEAT repeat domain-containing protein [Chloroflexota bacterium]